MLRKTGTGDVMSPPRISPVECVAIMCRSLRLCRFACFAPVSVKHLECGRLADRIKTGSGGGGCWLFGHESRSPQSRLSLFLLMPYFIVDEFCVKFFATTTTVYQYLFTQPDV